MSAATVSGEASVCSSAGLYVLASFQPASRRRRLPAFSCPLGKIGLDLADLVPLIFWLLETRAQDQHSRSEDPSFPPRRRSRRWRTLCDCKGGEAPRESGSARCSGCARIRRIGFMKDQL